MICTLFSVMDAQSDALAAEARGGEAAGKGDNELGAGRERGVGARVRTVWP